MSQRFVELLSWARRNRWRMGMKPWIAIVLVLLSGAASARAQHPIPKEVKETPQEAVRFPDVGRHYHPIHTANPEAQLYFDQGMTLYYGFNHDEAVRSFRKAAELDPKSPMPWWGVALALGPNYNRDMDPIGPERVKQTLEAIGKAKALAKNAPAIEQAYVAALAKRYSDDPKSDSRAREVAYKQAMREIYLANPDDVDASALYAESLMVLKPWQLWSADGKPAEDTEEIVRVLEETLNRWPEHAGANHLYIHAIEASPWPERGLASAQRLMTAVPWIGHLVHMPGHIYLQTGDYELTAVTNEKAAKADEEYFSKTQPSMIYRMGYYTHNVHFIAVARAEHGNLEEAMKAANKLSILVAPQVKAMSMLQCYWSMPLLISLRFHRWNEILEQPKPDNELLISTGFWHYARARALARLGKRDEARAEQQAFEAIRKQTPSDLMYMANSAEKVFAVASKVLEASLATSDREAVPLWKEAVAAADGLAYAEPPDWYYPLRESLGAALLRSGEAREAEKVFRDNLRRHRRNARSLYGLSLALAAQKRDLDAKRVRAEFEKAWVKGLPLDIADY